ncbi:Uncharacterised protein [Phocoenobacter uteri]|uniref:Uncharacterized protein n=1 Tax=Phocoenobacter uteri TaxID=146806 RepID=A0A379CAS3_9PAST|nr:hypothetical protein [Phocoenobacter uteri]MDG6881443.1 hypothetical protein [Phocoenobacter uteri]SUB59472.1 Uncharacterised protein [Phocoenobacter uteri]
MNNNIAPNALTQQKQQISAEIDKQAKLIEKQREKINQLPLFMEDPESVTRYTTEQDYLSLLLDQQANNYDRLADLMDIETELIEQEITRLEQLEREQQYRQSPKSSWGNLFLISYLLGFWNTDSNDIERDDF